MGRRQPRGLKVVRAVQAAMPDGVELDELDLATLDAIRRTFDRAEALDADLARERASDEPSANRIALLSAEARLAETQGEKWGRDVVRAAQAVLENSTKNPDKVRAARVRWSGAAAGKAL